MQGNPLFGNTFHCSKAGLTGISGGATTYTTSATALMFAIRGKAFTKAQVSGGATPTTGGISGAAITLTAGFGRAVVWAVNAAGTVAVFEGPIVALDGANAFTDQAPPQFPVYLGADGPLLHTSAMSREFARRWGDPVQQNPLLKGIDGFPELIQVTKIPKETASTEAWHYDSCYTAVPPKISILAAVCVPRGGDTMWCNQYQSYERLSPVMLIVLVA